MRIDNALILSAGFGTRMGEIGKVLPKILWPIFGKSLLELQVLYLKEIGVENIFINLHFQKDLILNYCNKNPVFKNVTFLVEDEILGIGGAIHNLSNHEKVNRKGRLLIVNADQFSFFSKEYWLKAYNFIQNYPCALFANIIESKFKYNETLLDKDGFLKEILPKDQQSQMKHLTYAGFGFVNLEKLTYCDGASNFFQSVANYRSDKIPMVALPENFEYWDFGTKERYFEKLHDLKKSQNSSSDFFKFLNKHISFNLEDFYYTDKERDILAVTFEKVDEDILSNVNSGKYVVGKGIIDKINL